jgi:hypothetical protein
VRTALALIVVLTAVVSWAGMSARGSVSAEPISATSTNHFEPPGDLVAFWSQMFEGATCQGWSSEHRAFPVYSCESADDFYSASGDTIVRVEWWGDDQTLSGITEFLVRFCEDDTTGRFHFPGDLVYEEPILDFTAEHIAPANKYYYTCDLPGGFAPAPNNTYWISIIGIHSGTHGGHQWFWYECVVDDYWGAEGALKSAFWGYPEWTPWSVRNSDNHHVEHAFILYSRGDTPVEHTSWAEIKAMFR